MTPNIVYILADDLGYGDPGCNNSASAIPTPNIDRLAANGIRFTDAHAGSSVCTPSRYALLTGRYGWRSRLKRRVLWEWDGSLIEEERRTVADLLRENGYGTACIGKWHLGWDWALKDGSHANDHVTRGERAPDLRYQLGMNVDYAAPVDGGPVDRGFDSYFGVDVPNFPPYTWFEDNRLTQVPTVEKPDHLFGNAGPSIPGWSHEAMIPEFTRRAVSYIESQSALERPFFLYFALTSPHTPVVPNDRFMGMSRAGKYGDFVCEVDWVVGQVMDALDRSGLTEDTLFVFTSDNGPERESSDEIGVWERIRQHGHYSMGGLRGIKRDVWEGGHRVPFIARWPAVAPAGAVCSELIGLGDFMATCAEFLASPLGPGEAEDSVSIMPILRGAVDTPVRNCAVHHSASGKFAIRARVPGHSGDWVLIDSPSGTDNLEPDWFRAERGYEAHNESRELFNLSEDIVERCNLYRAEPEIARELGAMLDRAKSEAGTSATCSEGEVTE